MNYDEVYASNSAYFGKPFPEVIDYFKRQGKRGNILDVGCGQGRNAIPLAEMGYKVHGIDTSSIAIGQLKTQLENISLNLKVEHKEFISLTNLDHFDFILLDGFFHFYDHELADEEVKMRHLLENVRPESKLVFCFADHSDSVSAFRQMISKLAVIEESQVQYEYTDPVSQWKFETNYFFSVLQSLQ
ncbi:class I SAM-dependent methyltransferase [Cryomorphaceae bacterium 1068]|nr:class I SAM-dependent methyltransferase [Cryomorphaceae bacterium 1068]